jgi:hypothetical protein
MSLITLMQRRWRKKAAEEDGFDPNAFRQSAVLVGDSPSSYGAPRNPRPPTMIERKMANIPTSSSSPSPGFGGFGNEQQYQNEYHQHLSRQHPGYAYTNDMAPSFSPGQVIPSPTSPTAPNPFQSPISSNYDTNTPSNDQLVRQPSTTLSRQDSSANYINMSRSSVTPYQAVQYAEINRRLQPTVVEADESSSAPMPSSHDFPPVPGATLQQLQPPSRLTSHSERGSPFADPDSQDEGVELDIHLQPPSPSSSRITSKPPTLPEITPTEKTFSSISPISYDFPVSAGPSPFANSFGIPARDSSVAMASPSVNRAPAVASNLGNELKRPESTYTMYGAEDAYGGI